MKKLKVFIGSSSEQKKIASWIEEILHDLGKDEFKDSVETLAWWDIKAFPNGKSFYESLISIVDYCNCAILLVAEEDLTNKRGETAKTPRDNILLELGMFAGRYGREQTLIAQVDKPSLPTDLAGISTLKLKLSDDESMFKTSNRAGIRGWVNRVLKNQALKNQNNISWQFPKLYESIVNTITTFKSVNNIIPKNMDLLAANLFTQISSTLDEDSFIAGFLKNRIKNEIKKCNSIYATDVLGPAAWVTPNAYHYLSIQIKEYIRRNTDNQGNNWNLIVNKTLGRNIKKACDKVKDETGIGESFSLFDNPTDFEWHIGEPKLQFARILLWSKEELLSPIGASVIAIHQAFNVPIFYLEVEQNDKRRNADFILFERKGGKYVSGFYNSKKNQFRPQEIEKGGIPQVGKCIDIINEIFDNEELRFAVDARHIESFKD